MNGETVLKTKKWIRTAAVAALVVSAATACGSDEQKVKGTPVASPKASPDAKVAPLRPAPGDKAPPLEQIKYGLEGRVIAMAGMVAKPTTSTCDTGEVTDQPQKFTCTVTYMGTEVPFSVETKGGFILMQYTATPTKGGVISREGVHAQAWKNYGVYGGKAARSLRCDEIPEVRLVPVDKPSGYKCYVGEGGLKGDYDVIVGSNGMRFH
ncbi:hypothetical protein GCM10009544_09540 [Streptomyces stramineus]|uniref:Lipoprotein n=2 Tax=Streptomyces TaxID=1883 RepID=A0ABN0ZII2_9ACTN